MVFVEDYDMKVAREMVQGVDLWLNNPRRGEEACGTSGMKAGINGVLNLSILDGWFDEAYEHRAAGRSATASRTPRIRTHCTPARFIRCWRMKSCRMFYENRNGAHRGSGSSESSKPSSI